MDTAYVQSTVPDPAEVAVARRLVRSCCVAAMLDSDSCDVAVLLTSELVTNAIVHGGSSARVRMVGSRHRLRVEVGDDNPCLPSRQEPSDEATGGRGLAIVDALAWHWGTSQDDPGKVVWFELRSS